MVRIHAGEPNLQTPAWTRTRSCSAYPPVTDNRLNARTGFTSYFAVNFRMADHTRNVGSVDKKGERSARHGCVSLNELGDLIRLILYQIMQRAMDQAGFDVSAPIGPQASCNSWDQLGKR